MHNYMKSSNKTKWTIIYAENDHVAFYITKWKYLAGADATVGTDSEYRRLVRVLSSAH